MVVWKEQYWALVIRNGLAASGWLSGVPALVTSLRVSHNLPQLGHTFPGDRRPRPHGHPTDTFPDTTHDSFIII